MDLKKILPKNGPPIDQEVISQVEEFKKEFMESTPEEAKVDKVA